MTTNDLHVVLGATGGTGSAVVRALEERGCRVRAASRRGDAEVPAGVEPVAADVTQADDLRRVLDGAAVVYHCAQPEYPRWAQDFPGMNRAVLAGCEEAGAVLVFADNLYMYDPSEPISEATPEVAPTQRGRLRKAMADELLGAHREGRVRVRIGRSSDYFGPRGLGTTLGERLFPSILAGKKTQWMGSLDAPHTASYLPDMGRALAILGEQDGADGRAWVLPADAPLTGREFIALAAEAAGTEPKLAVITPGMMRMAGLFSPMIRAYAEMLPQWTRPFTVDAGTFATAFGPFEVTPNAEAIATTVAWFRSHAAASSAAA